MTYYSRIIVFLARMFEWPRNRSPIVAKAKPSAAGKNYVVKVQRDALGRAYWSLWHKNGQHEAHSEWYTSVVTCRRIAKNLADAGGFEYVDETLPRKSGEGE